MFFEGRQIQQAGMQAPVNLKKHGEYLVNIMDCAACHTPKTMTAQGPSPDPISTKSAEAPTPVPKRTAEKDSKHDAEKPKKDGGFNPFPSGTSTSPERNMLQPAVYEQTAQTNLSPASPAKPALPSMIRSAGWRPRASSSEPSLPPVGPDASGPSLQVVKATN